MNKKQQIIKKKKVIIIASFILALLLISAILSATYFTLNARKKELTSKNTNILYYNEAENRKKEEDNVIVVGILDKETETNENNEEQPNNQEPNNQNVEEPKKVEIPYYIKVNNQANVVTIYKKDSKGKYTVPIKAMICSIGDATPETGVFTMSDKYTWRLLQGDVYGQYAYRITGHILFHSVPYVSQDKSTLEWWEYDKLGTKASLGCIRLKVEDAKWIYENCVAGTQVEFYSDKNPGPLGKPKAQKIGEDEEVRNWDPTDPDPRNPWKEYLKRKEEASKENVDTEDSNNLVNPEPNINENNNIQDNSNSQENIIQDFQDDLQNSENIDELNGNI